MELTRRTTYGDVIELAPAVVLTCATLALFRELMTEDFPTLGRPTMPTVMAVLMFALRV